MCYSNHISDWTEEETNVKNVRCTSFNLLCQTNTMRQDKMSHRVLNILLIMFVTS